VSGRTVLGLGLVTGAALCYNLGVVLQAAEIRRPGAAGPAAAPLDPRIFVRLARAPRWAAGAGLNLLGWVLQAWAVTLLPLSVVQPGLTVGFVFLFALSHAVLGEKAGAREWVSAAVLAGGILLVAAAAPAPGVPARDAGAWLLAGLPIAAAAAWPYVQRSLASVARGPSGERQERRPARAHGRREGKVGGERRGEGPWSRGPGWASLGTGAGAAYALTGIATALGARLLVEGHPAAALAAGAFVAACGALGLLSETSALQAGRATAVVPLMTAVDTIVPVALAPVLFHEPLRANLPFWGGLVLVAAGIAGLTTSTRLPVAPHALGSSNESGRV
jgi:uncharacterized membrane protein